MLGFIGCRLPGLPRFIRHNPRVARCRFVFLAQNFIDHVFLRLALLRRLAAAFFGRTPIIVVFVIVGDVFVVDDIREQVVGFVAAAPTGAAFAAAAFRPVIVVFFVVEWVGVVGWGWGRRYGGCGE